MVTLLQFLEGLTDRQAAEAVRSRIDWKYLLGLEPTDTGFHVTVLHAFRTRLIAGRAELRLLTVMLERLQRDGLLKARGRQRTDSTHILAAVRTMNRLEIVGETLRFALNRLAIVAPDWLRAQVTPEWFARYSVRVENYRLGLTRLHGHWKMWSEKRRCPDAAYAPTLPSRVPGRGGAPRPQQ